MHPHVGRHPCWIKAAVFGGVVERHTRGNELHQILVIRDYHHIHILLCSLPCQGPDEVVCLVELIHKHRQTECTRYCLTLLQLPRQGWRGEGTIGFIGREKSVAEG